MPYLIAQTVYCVRYVIAGGFGMRAPTVHLVPADRFTRWMQERGKFGGQNKVPRVLHDSAAVHALIGDA